MNVLGTNVFLIPAGKEQKSKGGIILEETPNQNIATIAYLGSKVKDLRSGTRVIYKSSHSTIEVEGTTYLITDESNIIAVLEE